MKNKFLILVVTLTTLVSCNGKKDESVQVNKQDEVVIKENFNVEITAVSSKKDDFALYFTEDNTINFKPENAIWRAVKGNNEEETIYFELTPERVPTNIRLDFGLNKEQDSVCIKSIKVDFYGNSFNLKGSEFYNYFNKDEQFASKIDISKGTITLYKKGNEYKTPFFYPNDLNNKKIKEITTKK